MPDEEQLSEKPNQVSNVEQPNQVSDVEVEQLSEQPNQVTDVEELSNHMSVAEQKERNHMLDLNVEESNISKVWDV